MEISLEEFGETLASSNRGILRMRFQVDCNPMLLIIKAINNIPVSKELAMKK